MEKDLGFGCTMPINQVMREILDVFKSFENKIFENIATIKRRNKLMATIIQFKSPLVGIIVWELGASHLSVDTSRFSETSACAPFSRCKQRPKSDGVIR